MYILFFYGLCFLVACLTFIPIWLTIRRRRYALPEGQLVLETRVNGKALPAPDGLFEIIYNGTNCWYLTVTPSAENTFSTPRSFQVLPCDGPSKPSDSRTFHTSQFTHAIASGSYWDVGYATGSTLAKLVLVRDEDQPDRLELWFDRGWAHFIRIPLS